MQTKADRTSRSPSVAHITKILQERIRTGQYRDGQWLPAERMLAEDFQVSRATIRQALDDLENQGFLTRSNACRPLVRLPASIESASVLTERRNISIWVVSDPSDLGAYTTLQGVQKALNEDTFRLVIASPTGQTLTEQVASEARFLERVASDRDNAGVLIWYRGGEANAPALEKLRVAQVPIVFLDRRPPAGFSADHVGIDNLGAARQLIEHLVEQGHRRIAHITNPEAACTVEERREGYRAALEAAGIAFDPDLVVSAGFVEEVESQYAEIVEHLLGLPDPPTAVFAVNDYSAMCLLDALRLKGVEVPTDMAVAGFDDLERWRPGQSFLTTISQPFAAMGKEAVRLLMERIEAGAEAPARTLMLDASLVVRDSSAKSTASEAV